MGNMQAKRADPLIRIQLMRDSGGDVCRLETEHMARMIWESVKYASHLFSCEAYGKYVILLRGKIILGYDLKHLRSFKPPVSND